MVHLVGGDDVSRGRVEYCYQGSWYSVCASDWDERGNEARVICTSLGFALGDFVLKSEGIVAMYIITCKFF